MPLKVHFYFSNFLMFFEKMNEKNIPEYFGWLERIEWISRYVRYPAEKLTPLSQLGKWIFMSLSRPPNDNLFSTILYIQHLSSFYRSKKVNFLLLVSIGFLLGSIGFGWVWTIILRSVLCSLSTWGIFYHIWVGKNVKWLKEIRTGNSKIKLGTSGT